MKKTLKFCTILPFDSTINNCVSKYALKTYDLQENLGLKTSLTLKVTPCVVRYGLFTLLPLRLSFTRDAVLIHIECKNV